jgi:AsmA protein
MQDIDSTYERSLPVARRSTHPRRLILLGAILLPLLVIVLVLPLLNINRFQHRIVASLSESLGRPIHLDNISLTVFPLPGLTIDNLVVSEDPAFGAEPFVRASNVRATLRFSSLWRRRIEFSRISFTDPSINLVRTSQGKWNLGSILLQASRISAAPTAQTRASSTPRFPYIEATGARLNLKLGQEKTPFSITEADIALWLSNPQEWQLRLEGRPVRTDTNVTDTGTLRMEGTLGHAAVLNDMPIDLKAEWRDAPLGEATHVLLGDDAGLRGTMTLSTLLRGTVGESAVETTLHLADLRRADFVPAQALSVDAECQAIQTLAFSALTDLRCSWPPALSTVSVPRTFALTGSLPDTRHLSSASLDLGTPGIPATTLLSWMHIVSNRFSPKITATGSLAGSIVFSPETQWTGQLSSDASTLTLPAVGKTPVFDGPVTLRLVPSSSDNQHPQFVLAPIPLALGGNDFATFDGHFDRTGYTLHLTGTSLRTKLVALGKDVPQIGDGLDEVLPPEDTATPIRFDLTTTRTWGGAQPWQQNSPAPSHHLRKAIKPKAALPD